MSETYEPGDTQKHTSDSGTRNTDNARTEAYDNLRQTSYRQVPERMDVGAFDDGTSSAIAPTSARLNGNNEQPLAKGSVPATPERPGQAESQQPERTIPASSLDGNRTQSDSSPTRQQSNFSSSDRSANTPEDFKPSTRPVIPNNEPLGTPAFRTVVSPDQNVRIEKRAAQTVPPAESFSSASAPKADSAAQPGSGTVRKEQTENTPSPQRTNPSFTSNITASEIDSPRTQASSRIAESATGKSDNGLSGSVHSSPSDSNTKSVQQNERSPAVRNELQTAAPSTSIQPNSSDSIRAVSNQSDSRAASNQNQRSSEINEPKSTRDDTIARTQVRSTPQGESRTETQSIAPQKITTQGDSRLSSQPIETKPSESFTPRRETGLQLPDVKQSSGRTEGGAQLPETKQTTGRSDTAIGGASNPNIRPGPRNDANTAKLPDAKTLAGMDQKPSDKLNPPGSGGIPVVAPGLPDIFGGLKGDKDSRPGKNEPGSREGKDIRPGGADRDGRGEPTGAKDGRALNPENKLGPDGRPFDQGGSNLVHDGGSSGKPTTRAVDAEGKSIGNRANQNADGKPAPGDPGQTDRSGKLIPNATTRTDKSNPGDTVRTDVTGKLNPSDTVRTDATGKLQPQDKGHPDSTTSIGGKGASDVNTPGRNPGARNDANQGTTNGIGSRPDRDNSIGGKGDRSQPDAINNQRGDKPFVLPPGSLPVPDLVAGIRNIRQNLDPRIGRTPLSEDVGKGGRSPDKIDVSRVDSRTGSDGSKTVVTGGTRSGELTIRDPRTANESIKNSQIQNDGVKTAITGGTNTGEGRLPNTSGGRQSGDRATGVNDSSAADGKLVSGRTNRNEIAVPPPPSVQFGEMIGNLKAIASKIFPQDGRPGAFDNCLPGRKTERLDANLSGTVNQRQEPIIPFNRALGGERDIRNSEQFVIRLPQTNKTTEISNNADRSNLSQRPEAAQIAIPKDGKTNTQNSDLLANEKLDTQLQPMRKGESSSANHLSEAPNRAVKDDVTHLPAADKHETVHTETVHTETVHNETAHDEAAENLLTNLELVGLDTGEIVDEEIVVPLAPIEHFGGTLERISDEDDVMFDGDDASAQGDEQDTRYQYIVEAGDTIEMISIKVFKNVSLAPLIYETNKDSIPIGMQDGRMSFILTVGMIIWLPFPREIKDYMERANLQ